MSNDEPPAAIAVISDAQALSNPSGVVSVTAVGIMTVLISELIKSQAIEPVRFLAQLDALAASPLQAPQSAEETRLEQSVFELARRAVRSAQKEAS